MIKAARIPGTQPARVKIKTIITDPQPLSITANGGNKMANRTRKKFIINIITFCMLNETNPK